MWWVLSTPDTPARTGWSPWASWNGVSPWSCWHKESPSASGMLRIGGWLHTLSCTCLPSRGAYPPLHAQRPGLGARNDVRLWVAWTVFDIWCEGEEAWTEGKAVRITEHSTSNFPTPTSGSVDGPGSRSVEEVRPCMWTQQEHVPKPNCLFRKPTWNSPLKNLKTLLDFHVFFFHN